MENIFTFGMKVTDFKHLRSSDYDSYQIYNENSRVKNKLDLVGSGLFNPEEPQRY